MTENEKELIEYCVDKYNNKYILDIHGLNTRIKSIIDERKPSFEVAISNAMTGHCRNYNGKSCVEYEVCACHRRVMKVIVVVKEWNYD